MALRSVFSPSTTRSGLLCTALLICTLACSPLSAQSRDRDAKKKDSGEKSASPQQLESRISKAEEQLLSEDRKSTRLNSSH